MAKSELQEILKIFSDGSSFGDPDAQLNAEQRLQVLVQWSSKKSQRDSTGSPFFKLLSGY